MNVIPRCYYTRSVTSFIMTCICVYRGDESSCGQTDVIRLCETWFDGQKKINDSSSDLVADIILGLSAQPAEREIGRASCRERV